MKVFWRTGTSLALSASYRLYPLAALKKYLFDCVDHMTTVSHNQELDELAEDRSNEEGILKAMCTALISELEPWRHIHPNLR